MTLCVSPAVDEARWDAQLAALGSPIFHSPVWAHYVVADHSSLSPRYCSLLDDAGAVRGMALLFLEASRNPVLRWLSARMHCDAHPVVEANDTNLFVEMVRQLEAYAGDSGVLEFTLGSSGTPGNRVLLDQLGYDLKDRYEFVLPLDRTDDEMRAAMERRRRRTIQKAIDAGITVDLLPFEAGIRELRRLQEFTSERLKRKGAIVAFGRSAAR